jgi:mannose/fructose-specific phosphotransferase system component IIA
MNQQELMEELDLYPNTEVFVEVNGVVHRLHEVQDTSQGIILLVDTFQEEREMR